MPTNYLPPGCICREYVGDALKVEDTCPIHGTTRIALFKDLPLGARFRYPTRAEVYVKISDADCGLVANWEGIKLGWKLQGIYTFAESPLACQVGKVILAEPLEPEAIKLESGHTSRGFAKHSFTDFYGAPCSIQQSSLATDDAIWFGVEDPNPQIMAADAAALGIETTAKNGWIDYPLPKQVMLRDRMHLNREQVRDLLPILHKFVETGEI